MTKGKSLTLFVSFVAAALAREVSAAAEDDTWGGSWNDVIGKANYTVTGYAYWNGVKTGSTRGSVHMLFDGKSDLAGNDSITTTYPSWAKLVLSDSYETGKKLVLKKYRIDAGSTSGRQPKSWKIYGCSDPSACFTTDGAVAADADLASGSLTLIDSRSDVATSDYASNSLSVDISENTKGFRAFVFVIESNNGASMCQIGEWYLFGEVSAKIGYNLSGDGLQFADGGAKAIAVTPTYPTEGVTVEYSTDQVNWSTTSPAFTAVGDYTVHYRLIADGFATESGSAVINIVGAAVLATGSDCLVEYDGLPHSIAVSVMQPESGYTVFYRLDEKDEWSEEQPTFTEAILPSAPTLIYWKAVAEGRDPAYGTNTVVIDYDDITAAIRTANPTLHRIEAEVATEHTTANNQWILDGNVGTRIFFKGTNFVYAISNEFCSASSVIAKAIEMDVDENWGVANVPKAFKVLGYQDEEKTWIELGSAGDAVWAFDAARQVYSTRIEFADNAESFRQYRLAISSPGYGLAKQFTEFRMRGLVGAEAKKNIIAEGVDTSTVYDGQEHGISVSVTRPSDEFAVYYSLRSDGGWKEACPKTKGLVSAPLPIYWKVAAEGFATKQGVSYLTIAESAQVDVNISEKLQEAGTDRYAVSASGTGLFCQQASASPANFMNGSYGDRNGWTGSLADKAFILEIGDDFHAGDKIVVKGVALGGVSNQVWDANSNRLPQNWSIAGSTDGEEWIEIASYTSETFAEWTAADFIAGTTGYYRRTNFENGVPYRKYRLFFSDTRRVHLSEIVLYGDVGESHGEHLPYSGGIIVIIK